MSSPTGGPSVSLPSWSNSADYATIVPAPIISRTRIWHGLRQTIEPCDTRDWLSTFRRWLSRILRWSVPIAGSLGALGNPYQPIHCPRVRSVLACPAIPARIFLAA